MKKGLKPAQLARAYGTDDKVALESRTGIPKGHGYDKLRRWGRAT